MPKAIEVPHHEREDFQKCSVQACVNLLIKNNNRHGSKEDPRLQIKHWLKAQIGQLVFAELVYINKTKTAVYGQIGIIVEVLPVTSFYPSLELLISDGLVKATAANVYLKYS